MELRKYFPCFRKALLSTLAFWGCYFLRVFAQAFVIALYTDADTKFDGLPPIVNYLIPAVCFLAAFPYFYDCFLCDFAETKRYYETLNSESFSIVNELKSRLHNAEFIVTHSVFAFWMLCVYGFLNAFAYTALYMLCELLARRAWFKSRAASERVKQKRFPYAVYLVAIALRYCLMIFGLIFLVGIVKMSIGSIWGIVSAVIIASIALSVAITLALFVYWRIRAIKIQRRLFKKLRTVSRENGLRFKEPKGVYSALLLQKPLYFTLESRHKSFNIVLVPTLLRKTPLYFLGDGVIERVRSFYFMRVELFKKSSYIEYKLAQGRENTQNVILLSPVPRQIFIGPVGAPTEADNASVVDNALLYTGTAFCNFIERVCG